MSKLSKGGKHNGEEAAESPLGSIKFGESGVIGDGLGLQLFMKVVSTVRGGGYGPCSNEGIGFMTLRGPQAYVEIGDAILSNEKSKFY